MHVVQCKIAKVAGAFLMACLIGVIAVKAQGRASQSTNDVENLLKQMEQDWTTAEIKKDIAAFDRILADDWIQIDWEGKTDTKKQWLEFVSSPDFTITTARIVEMKVRQFGRVAVVTGVNEEKSTIRGKDASGRYAWTDVLANRNGRWHAVASQVTPIPNSEPSQGSVEKYIRDSEAQWAEAVANGDVSVMQRILADDYIGVDAGDGHLYDKAEAISWTGEHHNEFISNHLNDVKMRFFGNTAVAQGSESWERRVGEPRRGRFVWTDTWLLRNGRWQIVAAEDLIASPLPAKSAGASNEPHATATSSEVEIKALYDRWARAFGARDIDAIMSIYAPGDEVLAYDVAPPLQYRGKDAYRKGYLEFLAQYDGSIHVEYRDMRIMSSGDVGLIHALERFTGKLKNGQQSDMWLRATSGLRKIDGKWFIVHDHVSVPVDFEPGKAALELKPQ
jgi:uncharacterized protein (TIGR02246 family)